MLVLRIAFGIICVIAGICTAIFFEKEKEKATSVFSKISFWGTIAFTIWSVVEIIKTPSNLINWIVILIFAAAIYILKEGNWGDGYCKAFKKTFLFFLVISIIGGMASCVDSYGDPVDCDAHVTISTTKILSATDGTMVNGSMSGGGFLVWHISGSVSENPVYRYYYQIDDGGIKLGEIPAKSTTIYYIEDGKTPYIEVIKSTECYGYYTGEPNHHYLGETSTTYKLYVPKGSILEIFQFDGN